MSLIPEKLREEVVRRARNRCEYCQLSQDSQVATFPVDHVIPVTLFGPTELDNLALACPRCNAAKWKYIEALDEESGRIVALFNPRTQKWSEHFHWPAEDSTLIAALTPTGRATVSFLELNSSQHVAIRMLLVRLAMHPPVET